MFYFKEYGDAGIYQDAKGTYDLVPKACHPGATFAATGPQTLDAAIIYYGAVLKPAPEPEPAPEPIVFEISKLKLVDMLIARDLDDTLYNLMDTRTRRRFDAAQVLLNTDPMVVATASLMPVDAEEVQAILWECRA